ncbi:hypothetical protein L210DRAFT_3573822 [Boletus edulis BED1]|uniref:Uncharacterized protein n=1 Tax=Boletus edulis BED1 TaxID=1328754 RepID=A0AAD4BCV1_BOLED|nr:hypothetical protein L210DRAFT_3573822 [Boletus edulis BED1]
MGGGQSQRRLLSLSCRVCSDSFRSREIKNSNPQRYIKLSSEEVETQIRAFYT